MNYKIKRVVVKAGDTTELDKLLGKGYKIIETKVVNRGMYFPVLIYHYTLRKAKNKKN